MLVGDTGFEPVTSSVSDMGNRFAEIRPSPFPLVRGGLRFSTDSGEPPRNALRGYTRGYIPRIGKPAGGEPPDQLDRSQPAPDVPAERPDRC
jgi:hypothetical protein